MTFSPEIVIGPPGTGKTTALLNEVAKVLGEGTPPNRVGFVAFTKKAATEAIERASEQFNLTPRQLPYFRTLHSLAFRALGISKDRMLTPALLKEFGHIMGLKVSGKVSTVEGGSYGSLDGDKALFISGLARLKCVPLREQWKEANEDMGYYAVERVHLGLEKFKKARGLFDFTDLLEKFTETGYAPELDLLVVDEAQDLSKLQWQVVFRLATKAKRVIVAGDDDQAIFKWAGADLEYFINLTGNVTTLSKSYRLPQEIYSKASELIDKIAIRRNKVWSARDQQGSVTFQANPDTIDMSHGSWLILARNAYFLEEVIDKCRREGWIYEAFGRKSVSTKTLNTIMVWEALRHGETVEGKDASDVLKYIPRRITRRPSSGHVDMEDLHRDWGVKTKAIWHEAFERMSLEERMYIVAALKRGEKPTQQPRIRMSTIHGSKGGEADSVILYSDMARRTYTDMQKDQDNERRVFYVGATRAKENLHIILPNTDYFFGEL